MCCRKAPSLALRIASVFRDGAPGFSTRRLWWSGIPFRPNPLWRLVGIWTTLTCSNPSILQSPVSRAYIRALVKRAAAAINNDRMRSRDIAHDGFELLDSFRLGIRSGKDRALNVGADEQRVKADENQGRAGAVGFRKQGRQLLGRHQGIGRQSLVRLPGLRSQQRCSRVYKKKEERH